MPGKYVRSYTKAHHIQENRHFSINATKQLTLQEPYWWPTIAENLLLFITLCTSCHGKGDELPTEEGSHQLSTSEGVIPYKETSNDWKTHLIEYMTHGEFKIGTILQREQREII